MSTPSIMITPAGYDDVDSVLQRLGGSLADTRQLNGDEVKLLSEPAFLSGVQHLFLNCRSNITLDRRAVATIRNFVNSGGTLYASDWASSVVADAFGHLAEFSPREGPAGTVHAMVSDPYLAERIGNPIPINFDMSQWVRIKKFPTSADIYIMDINRNPLAVGFRVELGRVVFTSFHHHAQRFGSHSASENSLLEWLITLPTQHKLLLTTGLSLAEHRTASSKQMMGKAGNERQVMPVDPGNAQGLGVFVLSWDYDDGLEFSMRYLRDRESAEAEERSSNPPLVMTVRDPGPNDGVEIRRYLRSSAGTTPDEQDPFVFACGMRRDLLGDSNWFAAAVTRKIQALLGRDTTPGRVSTELTTDRLQSIAKSILLGLGYEAELRPSQSRRDMWTEIRAWSPDGSKEKPDIQAEAVVCRDLTMTRSGNVANFDGIFGNLEYYPIYGEVILGAERLLILLTFSKGDTGESSGSPSPKVLQSSSERITWRAVSSESLALGQGRETISAEEFLENHHAVVTVYRAEREADLG